MSVEFELEEYLKKEGILMKKVETTSKSKKWRVFANSCSNYNHKKIETQGHLQGQGHYEPIVTR